VLKVSKKKKKILATPIREEEIKELRAGDIVYLNGDVYTARDKAHQRILENVDTNTKTDIPIPKGAVLYHCGPLVRRKSTGDWEILAAGPTTSSRMEATTPEIIEKLQIRGIIGKGGMGIGTRTALQRYGCVYFAMTGGAAVLAAAHIKAVKAVYWEDLGLAEAVWHLRVDDFGPLVVSMDANGKSLYEEITEAAEKKRFDSLQPRTQ
jgi:fumarate hydratase subunit beta